MNMIRAIKAAQRLDSSGDPTVQVNLTTDDGTFHALVPAGKTNGPYEAVELRDNDKAEYRGLGVKRAIRNVQDVIGPALIEREFSTQTQLRDIDEFMLELDGTPKCERLGANAILGVSMACARAGAAAAERPLYEFLRHEADFTGQYVIPVPFFNALNGGIFSGDVMAFQEIMVAPVGAKTFEEAMRVGSELHHAFRKVLDHKFGHLATGTGDEGGFAPPVRRPEDGMDLLQDAIDKCGYSEKTKFAIHASGSNFYDRETHDYNLGFPDKPAHHLSSVEMRQLYKDLIDEFPIVLLEDPFHEEDWDSWAELVRTCDIEIVGDTLLASNPERVLLAHKKQACNAVQLKIDQVGTVSKAIDVAKQAYQLGWNVFVTHRAGEAVDDFTADLVVALGAAHTKFGAPSGGERITKYNRILEIEEDLRETKKPHVYAGQNFRSWGSEEGKRLSREDVLEKQRSQSPAPVL